MDKSEKYTYELLEDDPDEIIAEANKVHRVTILQGKRLNLYFAFAESTNVPYWIVDRPWNFITAYNRLTEAFDPATSFLKRAEDRNLIFGCYDEALQALQALDVDMDYLMSKFLDEAGERKKRREGSTHETPHPSSTESKGGAS